MESTKLAEEGVVPGSCLMGTDVGRVVKARHFAANDVPELELESGTGVVDGC